MLEACIKLFRERRFLLVSYLLVMAGYKVNYTDNNIETMITARILSGPYTFACCRLGV